MRYIMHKRFAPVLFVSLLAVVMAGAFTACSSVKRSVQNHTVTLDLRERLGVQGRLKLHKATAYHGRYYCLYSYNSSFVGSGYMMEVVDKNSLAIEEILPPETNGYHYCDDLFVRHDTLFYHVYGSWCDHDFFLDTLSRKWVPCAKSDHLIAEDDDYRVYAVDHGEWGQATWFVNRATGLEYVVWGTGDVRRFRALQRHVRRPSATVRPKTPMTPSRNVPKWPSSPNWSISTPITTAFGIVPLVSTH